MCKRIEARVECPTCGYPYSEALYPLTPETDPGCEVEEERGDEPNYYPVYDD